MPYRGYWELAGAELANSSRAIAHLTPGVPVDDGTFPGADTFPGPGTFPGGGTFNGLCGCNRVKVKYDDSWEGLPALLGDPTYVVTNAPWFAPSIPQSREFAGIWVTDVQGLDSTESERAVQEAIGNGGAAGYARDRTRVLTFQAQLIACTNAGAEYGLSWLNRQLRRTGIGGGLPMGFFGAHPGGSAVNPASLWRTMNNVVLTKAARTTDPAPFGMRDQHRQSSLYRVEWEMTALSPYVYGPVDSLLIDWDTYTLGQIEWMHAPNCESPTDCALPVLFNAECVPATVDVEAMSIPTCGGCLPICEVQTSKWTLPAAFSLSGETAVSIHVTNFAPDPLSLSMWWQPCGSTDVCDRGNRLQISGLPDGATAVADSVSGRPYGIVGGDRVRQVGIVTTPSGAPWTPTVLDRNVCWELMAEGIPGADYTVEIVLQERER